MLNVNEKCKWEDVRPVLPQHDLELTITTLQDYILKVDDRSQLCTKFVEFLDWVNHTYPRVTLNLCLQSDGNQLLSLTQIPQLDHFNLGNKQPYYI